MPYSTTDDLTSAQRRQEIAAILGRGLHRYGAACRGAPGQSDSAVISIDQTALDVSAPGDPHVSWLAEPRT